jgi:hypothetical protein
MNDPNKLNYKHFVCYSMLVLCHILHICLLRVYDMNIVWLLEIEELSSLVLKQFKRARGLFRLGVAMCERRTIGVINMVI